MTGPTPNLHLVQVTTGQDGKEVTINSQSSGLDSFCTDTFAKVLTSLTSPYALTTTQPGAEAYSYFLYNFTGTLTGDFTIQVPVDKRPYKVTNNTSGGHNIIFKTVAGTGITIGAGGAAALYCDGTNVINDPTSGGGFASLTARNAFTKAQTGPTAALTDASTVSWDGDVQIATLTIAGNRTLALITTPVIGTYILIITQGSGGSHTLDLSNYKNVGGVVPTLSTVAGAIDALTVVYDGTHQLLIGLQKAFA